MILHPTVVIGLGTTGKLVVANTQRYLYEVLNGEQLRLFQFVVLETATDREEQNATGARDAKPVDIKVKDIGTAIFTHKQQLQRDFDWCPNLTISGPGAGNKRAGGRLMLLANMEDVEQIIQMAIAEVNNAAHDVAVASQVNELLTKRGGDRVGSPFSTIPQPTILVVGTLAGGTCSGACIDLAYLIRRIAPNSTREAIFFMPDQGAIGTFKANTWAALSDLVYFTEKPSDYSVVWLNKAIDRREYSEDQNNAQKPYLHIYLVTQRDKQGNLQLGYNDSTGSPLLMMGGLQIAANLLGLFDLRQTRLSDVNTRVRGVVHETFFTFAIRGVTFPKYDISEAATCKIVAEHLCQYWLSSQEYYADNRLKNLKQEDINKLGRDYWNRLCGTKWDGLRGALPLQEFAQKIKDGKIAEVPKYLRRQLTENQPDSLYRAIHQNVENLIRALQYEIRLEFVMRLQSCQNLTFAEWFLDGIIAEIKRAQQYWEKLGIPAGEGAESEWQKRASEIARGIVNGYTGLSQNMVLQRLECIEDGLEQATQKLEMFLIYEGFSRLTAWIDTEVRIISISIRRVLEQLKEYANNRKENITRSLEDRSGPLLKITRSIERSFTEEINALAKLVPPIAGKDMIDCPDGRVSGMLYIRNESPDKGRDRVFRQLIELIQPELIRSLFKDDYAAISIIDQIVQQGIHGQVIQRAHATQQLSLPMRQEPMMGVENVPSFLLAKNSASATELLTLLRRSDQSFPELACKELPLFDHMAIFYQEGGKVNLDNLIAPGFKEAYNEVLTGLEGPGVIDPLRLLKKVNLTVTRDSTTITPDTELPTGTILSRQDEVEKTQKEDEKI